MKSGVISTKVLWEQNGGERRGHGAMPSATARGRRVATVRKRSGPPTFTTGVEPPTGKPGRSADRSARNPGRVAHVSGRASTTHARRAHSKVSAMDAGGLR